MLSFVWAEDELGNIGYQGKLPWHLPADLHHFKEKTINHPMLMGRKTFESFPGVLPKREHIILTHNIAFKEKYLENSQVLVFTDITALRKWLYHQSDKISIIGGASLFKEFANDVDILEKTKIYHQFNGDVKMPEVDYSKFNLVKKEDHSADENNKYDYTFMTYVRK